MKRLIIAATVALGFVCVSNANAAKYETVTTDLRIGYQLMAFVGHSPAEYAQAQRAANMWEARRHLGLGPLTITAVAIDNSAGVAKQIRWIGPDNTVAVVNIH